jgi:hypothetical protein
MTPVAQVGGPVKRGAGWFVPSAMGSWGYFVEMRAQKIRCTYLSFVHRRRRLLGRACKQIVAVRSILQEVPTA